MTKRYRVSDEAKNDLLDVWFYVFEFQQSDQRADAVVDAIVSAFDTLACHSDLGTKRDWLPGDLLAFPKDGYLVLYRVSDEGIEIARVSGGVADLLRDL